MASMTQDIQEYVESKPEYAEILLVYKEIRDLQEGLINSRRTESRPIDAALVRHRLLAGRPLLQDEAVEIEPELFHALAVDLLQRLPEAWSLRAETEQVLQRVFGISTAPAAAAPPPPAAGQGRQPDLQELAASYLADRVACLETLVAGAGVDPDTLNFTLQTLYSPFYEQAARPLRPFLADHLWTKSVCPICGGLPLMARLTATGNQRRLGCDLCLTEWVYPRTGCPFCGEGRPDKLPQFHLEKDKGRRVDVCHSCGGYIKTVDERELRRAPHLFLEDLVTAHLDILAQDQGYA